MNGKDEKNRRRPPGAITGEYLFRAAAYYLERYASSAANLRRVLERKVARRASLRQEDPAPFMPLIDETVARIVDLRLVDDEAFAAGRVASLRRRGTSRRQLEAKLMQKGVERDTIERAMASDKVEDGQAAIAYAKRRRLGPFRLRQRQERRDRDVAAMMRAGFSYSDAMRTIDGGEEMSADGEG